MSVLHRVNFLPCTSHSHSYHSARPIFFSCRRAWQRAQQACWKDHARLGPFQPVTHRRLLQCQVSHTPDSPEEAANQPTRSAMHSLSQQSKAGSEYGEVMQCHLLKTFQCSAPASLMYSKLKVLGSIRPAKCRCAPLTGRNVMGDSMQSRHTQPVYHRCDQIAQLENI